MQVAVGRLCSRDLASKWKGWRRFCGKFCFLVSFLLKQKFFISLCVSTILFPSPSSPFLHFSFYPFPVFLFSRFQFSIFFYTFFLSILLHCNFITHSSPNLLLSLWSYKWFFFFDFFLNISFYLLQPIFPFILFTIYFFLFLSSTFFLQTTIFYNAFCKILVKKIYSNIIGQI